LKHTLEFHAQKLRRFPEFGEKIDGNKSTCYIESKTDLYFEVGVSLVTPKHNTSEVHCSDLWIDGEFLEGRHLGGKYGISRHFQGWPVEYGKIRVFVFGYRPFTGVAQSLKMLTTNRRWTG